MPPATTVTAVGSVAPEGTVSCPLEVNDEELQPEGGPLGPHDQTHPPEGQPDAVNWPE